MRVLLISHTCQSRGEGQPRAAELAKYDDIELRLLIPQRFNHYGVWRDAEEPLSTEYSWRIRRTLLSWLGPAQNYLHFYPQLSAVLQEFKPDVIDLWEEPWSLVSAHTCWLRNRILPQAKIVSETEQNIHKQLPPPFQQFRRYVLKNAAFCIGRSEEAVEVLRRQGFGGPAAAIPNAVDAELFRPLDRNACREEYKLSGFVAGFVGRLVEAKGVLDLVEALQYCAPDVRLLFAGDGPLRQELENRAQRLGLARRVLFLPHRPASELARVMNAIDVLILPSHTTGRWKEQFGRVLIEAHACATPVIGSDSGAIPSVIGDGGLVVPERKPRAIAAAIEELRANPSQARLCGETGRRQVEENYTWKRVAERLHTIYRQL